ncbi:MAG TPA: response regulator [Usitatibacter sp.]|jgi:DNA-binding response OmpR family regulator|nr:response regulator [Usitatibacter sp.]
MQPQQRECRIVVVDDNQDAADMLADLLGAHGFSVRTAYSGTEALRLIDEYHPSIGILDIGLPDILGYDIAVEARRQLEDDVMLVAVTGWGAEKDVERAFDAGFDFHVTKPADPEDLIALIEERCWDVHGSLRSGRVRGSPRG